jgi:hypothetical protein
MKAAIAGVNPRIIDRGTFSIASINRIINGMLTNIPNNTNPEPADTVLPFLPA